MCEIIEKIIIENNILHIVCFDAYLECKNKMVKIPMLKCGNKGIANNDKESLLLQTISNQCMRQKCNTASTVWNKAFSRKFIIKNKLYFDSKVFHLEDLLFNLFAY